MTDFVNVQVDPANHQPGGVRLTVKAKKGPRRADLNFELDRAGTIALVEDLCRQASLCEPWKRG